VILTNYPFDRELVAERQRDRLAHSERMRRTEWSRGPRPTRRPRWSFTSRLRGVATQSRGAATTQSAALSTCP
jgi:hypothetical protein